MKKQKTIMKLALYGLGLAMCTSHAQSNLLSNDSKFKPGTFSFTENKGQFVNDRHQSVNDVLFKASGKNSDLWVTEKGVSYVFKQVRLVKENAGKENKIQGRATSENVSVKWSRVDMELLGASINRNSIVREEPMFGEINYNLGNGQQIHAREYQKITFPEVYPNIDWVITTGNEGMKYDFIVKPGGNVASIKLKYNNCDATVGVDGKLQISTSVGKMKEDKPIVYYTENSKIIGSSFALENNVISFNIDNYDKSKTLVIDPLQYVWATYYGGSDYETVYGMDTDGSGNVYVSGWTYSTDFPTLSQGGSAYFEGTQQGQSDAYILKFNSSSVRLWATFFGGSDYEQCRFISTDPTGNLWAVGSTHSTDFPIQNLSGAYNDATFNGTGPTGTWGDAFIAKFSPSGSLMWSTYFGGDSVDVAGSVRCNNSGEAFICGITRSPNLPVQALSGAYNDNTYNGGYFDAYAAKFSSGGALQWCTYFGGTDDDYCESIVPVSGGEVCFVGGTFSTDFPTMNPGGGAFFQATNNGGEDGYIVQFNSSLALKWATYVGGSDYEHYYFCNANATGKVMMLGYTASTDLPTFNPGSGAFFQSTNAGNYDLALNEFSTSNGAMTWGTYYGGPYDELAYTLDFDPSGNYFIGGEADTTGFPTQVAPGTYNDATFNDVASSFHADGFILSFNSSRVRTWATYFYGDNFDFVNAITFDNSGNLYVAGESASANDTIINPGSSAFVQTSNNGGDADIHISKFGPQSTGIKTTLNEITSLSVYPNPASNMVNVSLNNLDPAKLKIDVYTAEGKLIKTQYKLSSSGENAEISLPDAPTGLYFVKVSQGENSVTAKLIIAKK